MHVEAHESIDDLKRRAKAQRDARVRIRMQAVVLAREGKTAMQIAAALGAARRPVQEWVARYNHGGQEALREGHHSGKPPRLKRDDEPKLKDRLDAGPLPSDGVCTLRAADVKRILEQEFNVIYSLKGTYKLLHRLGYSYLAPRPRHKHAADAPTQEAFKKTLWLSSKRSEPLILTGV
jgi:transposase